LWLLPDLILSHFGFLEDEDLGIIEETEERRRKSFKILCVLSERPLRTKAYLGLPQNLGFACLPLDNRSVHPVFAAQALPPLGGLPTKLAGNRLDCLD
jgi:hypothetical protein